LQLITMNVGSVTIHKFVGDTDEVTITFENSAIDSETLKIEVPLNASILYASIDVSPEIHNNKYPTDVKVNLGNDEDYEWEFSGLGYGSYGEQTIFTDGEDKRYLYFYNTTTMSANLFLPRNATIKNTMMELGGGTGSYDELYYVSIDYYGNNLYFHKSNGDGTWAAKSAIDTNIGRYLWSACAMADFDNDGDLDVVAGGQSGSIYLYEKMGLGNNFKKSSASVSTITSSVLYDFACGDFNNDGNYDFITSGSGSSIYMFAGDGKGNFVQSTISATGGPSFSYGKDAEDIDGDGNLDFIVGSNSRNILYYFKGQGNGQFNNPTQINLGLSSWFYGYTVVTDDFNNDGKVDIMTSYAANAMYYLEGNGDGTFKAPVSSSVNAGRYNGGDAYDYNMDGNCDIIATDGNWLSSGSEIKYYKGNGNFVFNYSFSLGFGDRNTYGGSAPPPKVIGANNPTLNVGDTGSGYDWMFTGRLEGTGILVEDYTGKLNQILKSPTYPSFTDQYGTELVKIPLAFTSNQNGLIRVSDFRIEYDYTATILKKNIYTLADELNEHIVYTEGDMAKLHFIVTSTSAGKLVFKNLNLIYNIPPDLKTEIPTLDVYEDAEDLNLLDLSKHFIDTDEPTIGLNYSVVYNSQSEHVDVYTNYTNMLKFTPLTPNWHGETLVQVQIIDSGNKKTYSNQFKIVVHAINDEPKRNKMIPDISLVEGEVDLELDLELREYFTDIENDYLLYSLEVDPQDLLDHVDKDITVVKDDDNLVKLTANGDFNTYNSSILDHMPIPIWIYCDDDAAINTYDNGADNFTYQEILVTVQPINDAPIWSRIPRVVLYEDATETFSRFIYLPQYIQDDETPYAELTIEVLSSNPSVEIKRSGEYLDLVNVPPDFYGSTEVTLIGTDALGKKSVAHFSVLIFPVNDAPTIKLTSHGANKITDESGEFSISGNMYDTEHDVKLVELKIESLSVLIGESEQFDWQKATLNHEDGTWRYDWNSSMVPDADYQITVRVYDGELTAETMAILRISNHHNFEPKVDILSPDDGLTLNGSVTITGTVYDPDFHGINNLEIRIGYDMDWTDIPLENENDTLWTFNWDSLSVTDDDYTISVRAFDGQDWSVPAGRMITIFNNQTLVVGDNKVKDESSENPYWLPIISLIVLILVIGLLIMLAIVRRGNRKYKEYVPEGSMDDLVDLETRLRPALGPGVSIEHQPLPAASGAMAIGAPALPASVPIVQASPYSLPSAGGTVAGPATGPTQGLPALPPAAPAHSGGSYGLYKPAQTFAPATAMPQAQTVKPIQPDKTK